MDTGLEMPWIPVTDLFWSKSLKVILIDSDFWPRPVLSHLVTLQCSRLPTRYSFLPLFTNFSKVKSSFWESSDRTLPGHERWGLEASTSYLAQNLRHLRKTWRIRIFWRASSPKPITDRGIKTWLVQETYPECVFLRKEVAVWHGVGRISHGPQRWESNWHGKDCRSVQRITINITPKSQLLRFLQTRWWHLLARATAIKMDLQKLLIWTGYSWRRKRHEGDKGGVDGIYSYGTAQKKEKQMRKARI